MPKETKNDIQFKDTSDSTNFKINVGNANMNYKTIVKDVALYESSTNTMAVEVFDGGIRQSFILENDRADKQYTINYEADNISHLEFAYIDGKTDGSIMIRDKNNEIIATIGAPWAKDKNGNEVDTYYKIDGTSIIQVIKPNETNEYPIVADPATYSTYIHWSKWAMNGKYRCLAIKPKMAGCGYAAGLQGWEFIYKKHHKSKYWKNTEGMEKQYICHAVLASWWKTPWHLEPARPNVSYAKTVAEKCNP